MILKVRILPTRSDTAPQKNRPKPLKSEVIAIKVAPSAARASGASEGFALRQRSWNMGDWKPTMVIPAVMLQKNTIHTRRKRLEKISPEASL